MQGYCKAKLRVNILNQGASPITSYRWSTGETTQEFISVPLTEAGTYIWTVTVENASGQVATASVSVNVLPIEGDLYIPYLDNGSTFEPTHPYLDNGTEFEILLPIIES